MKKKRMKRMKRMKLEKKMVIKIRLAWKQRMHVIDVCIYACMHASR